MRIFKDNLDRDGFFWLETFPEAKKQRAPSHDGLNHLWGYLEMELTTITSLFVGSGEVGVEGGQMYLRFAQREGHYILPGSSIKGAVRSLAEMLSPSCMAVVDDRDYQGQCKADDSLMLCPACGLFGALSYLGRLTFEDAVISNPQSAYITIFQRTEPRFAAPESEVEREKSFEFRKFYMGLAQRARIQDHERLEVLKPGLFCPLLIRLSNVQDWEMGLLILSLGAAPGMEFNWKLGGAKNRGFGLVSLRLRDGQCASGLDWMFGKKQPTALKVQDWVNAYIRQAKQWKVWQDVVMVVNRLREVYGHGVATGSEEGTH